MRNLIAFFVEIFFVRADRARAHTRVCVCAIGVLMRKNEAKKEKRLHTGPVLKHGPRSLISMQVIGE